MENISYLPKIYPYLYSLIDETHNKELFEYIDQKFNEFIDYKSNGYFYNTFFSNVYNSAISQTQLKGDIFNSKNELISFYDMISENSELYESIKRVIKKEIDTYSKDYNRLKFKFNDTSDNEELSIVEYTIKNTKLNLIFILFNAVSNKKLVLEDIFYNNIKNKIDDELNYIKDMILNQKYKKIIFKYFKRNYYDIFEFEKYCFDFVRGVNRGSIYLETEAANIMKDIYKDVYFNINAVLNRYNLVDMR